MGIETIDHFLMTWISHHRSPFMDGFFAAATWLGSLFLLLPLAIVVTGYLAWEGKRDALFLLGLGFGGAILITYVLKMVVRRPRPIPEAMLIPMPTDFSFPSAHTAQITAFCLCLVFTFYHHGSSVYLWLVVLVSLFLIFCVGFSRLYLQVHYASDVVVGILLPLIWVAGIAFLLRRQS